MIEQPSSVPDPNEDVLLQFQQDYEATDDKDATLRRYCSLHPHLEPGFRELAEMVLMLRLGLLKDLPLPACLGGCRIVRRIGRGGMGEVYEAVQEPLGRRVAIKVIRQGSISEESKARFLHEQMVLARLHQTHIVPIHAGGLEGNIRYFVMPFIEGAALHHVVCRVCQVSSEGGNISAMGWMVGQWAEERQQQSALRQQDPNGIASTTDDILAASDKAEVVSDIRRNRPLSLSPEYFRSVASCIADAAEAVQHAHDAGYLHRDIKPSNIMVDKDGHSWIIDFGLAKYVLEARQKDSEGRAQAANDHVISQLRKLVGTPQYMAPEQCKGEADPRSDVWGLGVTLYELLTLSPAFSGTNQVDLFNKIESSEPRPMQELVAKIPADLRTICRKAIRKKQEDRYPSAAALAQDLRRWLNHEPISARWTAPWERIYKWAQRRPAVAALTALVVIGAAVSLPTITILYLRADADRNEKTLAAEREAIAAQKAWEALTSLVDVTVQRNMARREQLSDEDRDYWREVVARFREFTTAQGGRPEDQQRAANAYFRVGQISRFLGAWKESEEAYNAACDAYSRLADSTTDKAEIHSAQSMCYSNLGTVLRETGRPGEAERAYGKAIDLRTPLINEFPANQQYRDGLAMTYNNLGALLEETGRRGEAERSYNKAIGLKTPLVDEFPGNPHYRHGLAMTYNNLGVVLEETGRPKEAEGAYGKAIGLGMPLVDKFPANAEYRDGLASSYNNLGNVLRSAGRAGEAEAEAAYGKAIGLRMPLVDKFPANAEYRLALAKIFSGRGLLRNDAGRLKEAEEDYRRAIDNVQKLVAQFPANAAYRDRLASTYINLGVVLRDSGRPREAEDPFCKALNLREPLVNEFPANADYRQELTIILNDLGLLRKDAGRLKEAEDDYRRAIDIEQKLVADFPANTDYRNGLAATLGNRAEVRSLSGDHAAAFRLLEQAFPQNEAALKSRPRDARYRRIYARNLELLTKAFLGVGDHVQAAHTAEKFASLDYSAGNYYNAACFLSLCVPVAAKDPRLNEGQRQEQARAYADRAVQLLQESVRKGYKDLALMKKDTDLDPIRDREDFQKILKDLEQTPSRP